MIIKEGKEPWLGQRAVVATDKGMGEHGPHKAVTTRQQEVVC